MVDGGALAQSVEDRDGVLGRTGDEGRVRVVATGAGMEGARPRLEPGRDPPKVEAAGLWYRSGEGLSGDDGL